MGYYKASGLLLLVLTTLAGCSSPSSQHGHHGHHSETTDRSRTTQLWPGKMLEDCVEGIEGHEYSYTFTASQPLSFNVHYHVGPDRVYLIDETVKERSDTFSIDSAHHHCVMWINNNAVPVKVKYTLKRTQ